MIPLGWNNERGSVVGNLDERAWKKLGNVCWKERFTERWIIRQAKQSHEVISGPSYRTRLFLAGPICALTGLQKLSGCLPKALKLIPQHLLLWQGQGGLATCTTHTRDNAKTIIWRQTVFSLWTYISVNLNLKPSALLIQSKQTLWQFCHEKVQIYGYYFMQMNLKSWLHPPQPPGTSETTIR